MRVGPGAAVEDVVAGAAEQCIDPAAAAQVVVAAGAAQGLSAVVADKSVRERRAVEHLHVGHVVARARHAVVGVPVIGGAVTDTDVDGRATRGEVHPVAAATAAVDHVGAAAAVEQVVAFATVERRGAGVAGERVASIAAVTGISGADRQRVAILAADQGVGAALAVDRVATAVALQEVVALTAEHGVGAGARVDADVVAGARFDVVGPRTREVGTAIGSAPSTPSQPASAR